jgi:hypothetical protein
MTMMAAIASTARRAVRKERRLPSTRVPPRGFAGMNGSAKGILLERGVNL